MAETAPEGGGHDRRRRARVHPGWAQRDVVGPGGARARSAGVDDAVCRRGHPRHRREQDLPRGRAVRAQGEARADERGERVGQGGGGRVDEAVGAVWRGGRDGWGGRLARGSRASRGAGRGGGI
eukprot:524294-Rhodomonas_salina.1